MALSENSAVLYYNSEITRDKNREIDMIDAYLNNLVKTTITSPQYFKHALHCKLKVNLDQQVVGDKLSSVNIDYVRIGNKGETGYHYYFVDEKKWIAEKTVELTLTMDTINTFKGNYEISDKTIVKRQHHDRWEEKTASGTTVLCRKIDKEPEGITPNLLSKTAGELCNHRPDKNHTPIKPINYYLIYREEDRGTGAITGWILDSQGSNYREGPNGAYKFTTTKQQLIDAIGVGGRAIVRIDQHGPVKCNILGPSSTASMTSERHGDSQVDVCYVEIISSTQVNAYALHYSGTGCYRTTLMANVVSIDWIVEPNSAIYLFYLCKYTGTWPSSGYPSYDYNGWFSSYSFVLTKRASDNQYPTHQTTAFKLLDLTYSENLKIIMLPYVPANMIFNTADNCYRYDPDYLVFTEMKMRDESQASGWRGIGVWGLKIVGAHFNADELIDHLNFQQDPLEIYTVSGTTYNNIGNASLDRDDVYESKIYHSDFYVPKFVYDNESYTLRLECNNYDPSHVKNLFKVDFIPTTSMGSKFMFHFVEYDTTGGVFEDYPGYMPVSRNNEVALFTSAYLDYMRNGINFDMKDKETGDKWWAINLAFQGVDSLANMMMSGGLSGLAGGKGLIQSLLNKIQEGEKWTNSQNRKIYDLKMQGTNVSVIEDTELLKIYAGNKLKYIVYEPTDRTKESICDLFYFCGYAVDKREQIDTTSRYWFNFVQADIIFEETTNITDEIGKDIKERWAEGITFMHSHLINNVRTWDWNQEKENWETWLVGYND